MNTDIIVDIDTMTSDEFNKARVYNGWSVFTKADLDLFLMDVLSKGIDVDIEKAKKDISKLVQKRIIDSIGRSKLVWIKPNDMIKRTDTKHTGTPEEIAHAEALDRHHHNTRVQRMGKDASYKQIERHFGKEVADKIRENHILQASTEKAKTPSVVNYKTAGGNNITVDPNAIKDIKFVMGKASSQADLESVRDLFVHQNVHVNGYSETQSNIVFNKFLRDGDREQAIINPKDETSFLVVDVLDVMLAAKKAASKPVDIKIDKTITEDNYKSKINEYVSDMVIKLTTEGQSVDKPLREGLKNNFEILKTAIDDDDFGTLKELLVTKNSGWRDFYEQYAGAKLPSTDRDTAMFLFKKINKK